MTNLSTCWINVMNACKQKKIGNVLKAKNDNMHLSTKIGNTFIKENLKQLNRDTSLLPDW